MIACKSFINVLSIIDTIKTVQQMQRLSCHGAGNCIQAGLGAFETAKLIVAQHGIGGLWSGLGITGVFNETRDN
jgi:hypothetical protein